MNFKQNDVKMLNSNRNFKLILLIISSAFVVSCSSSVRFSDSGDAGYEDNLSKGEVFYGQASYYADAFHGKLTASGEIFDMNKLTAAHKTLPFGTILNVKNLKNGRSVMVKINDRGPFSGSRVLDLSKAAAQALDMIRDGVIEVEITIME